MEKLIELLNEHFKEKYKNSKRNLIYFERYDDVNHGFNMNNEDRVYNGFVAEETILGKRYGFIGWLVDNDKIDFKSKNYPLKKCYPYYDDVLAIVCQNINTYEDCCKSCYDKYESLLMLLSIQDEPIEFLCSLLK